MNSIQKRLNHSRILFDRIAPLLLTASLMTGAHAGQIINITVTASGQGTVSPDGTEKLASDSNLDVSAMPDEGWQVGNWYVNGAPAGWTETMHHFAFGDEDVSIVVLFVPIVNTVHTSCGTEGKLSPGGENGQIAAQWGESLTFNATPNQHYHVGSWIVDNVVQATGVSVYVLPEIKSERYLEVTFAPDIYTIQGKTNAHGFLSPSGDIPVTYQDNLAFTATPQRGFDRIVWKVDSKPVRTNDTTFLLENVDANHTVEATFSSPQLFVFRTNGTDVVISWPATYDSHTLLETTNLANPTWTPCLTSPSQNGDNMQVLLSAPTDKRFFRLSYP
jgi:hypothetical protein